MIVREKKAQTATNRWYDFRYPDARTTLTLRGRRGWPDEVYWIPGGRPVLFEYKAEGAEPRKLQLHIHNTLRGLGYVVETHTSSAEAIASLSRHIENAKASKCAGKSQRAKKGSTAAAAASNKGAASKSR